MCYFNLLCAVILAMPHHSYRFILIHVSFSFYPIHQVQIEFCVFSMLSGLTVNSFLHSDLYWVPFLEFLHYSLFKQYEA